MRTRAKYGWMLIGLLVVLVASPAYGQALWRNFFTTNQNPVVDVVAGSNATVQATTVGVNTRRFTVNSVPPTQLPYTVITNAPWVTTYPLLWSWQSISNLQSAQMPSTVITNPPWLPSNAQLTNQIYASNVVSGGQLPNGVVASAPLVTNAQTAELQVVRPLVVQPYTAGTAPFDLGLVSVQNTGGGAGTYNHGAWLGFNAGRHSGAPVVTKRGIMMGLEDNYFDATGDGQYANEWYVEGWSPDGTTVQMSRPFYARGAQEDNGTNWWTILFNVGTLGANRQFTVRTGTTNLFTVAPTGITCSNATTIYGQVTTSGSGAQFSIKPNLTDSVNRRNWGLQTEVNAVGDFIIARSPTNGTSQPSITSLEITRDGKVGISNTAPVALLDVGGDIRAATTITATSGFTSGASASNYLGSSVTASNLYGTLQASNLVGSVPITLSGTLPWANLPQLTNSDYVAVSLANLGTPAAGHYPIMYCSDAITSWGQGAYVRWDGSNWRTWEGVVATDTTRAFLVNCFANGLNNNTPAQWIVFSGNPSGSDLPNSFQRAMGGYGGGSYGITVGNTACGGYFSLGTGTAGGSACYTTRTTIIAGSLFAEHTRPWFSALADSTDAWVAAICHSTSGATNWPTTGAGFVYDPRAATGHGITGAATNNWIAFTCSSSSYTFTDTGLPATTTVEQDALTFVLSTTNCVFYTNRVLAVTTTTTIPPAGTAFYLAQRKLFRVAGTTDKKLNETAFGTACRWATNRVF